MNFLDYALSLNPAVLSLPIMGYLNTYDGYNRAVTETGTLTWQKSRQGFGIESNSIGNVYQIADGPEQDFIDQTIFVYFSEPITANGTEQEFISKRGAGGIAWYCQFNPTGIPSIVNSGFAFRSGLSAVGSTSVSVRTTSNTEVQHYLDGIPSLTAAGADYTTQPNETVNICARYSANAPCQTAIAIAATFSSALTDDQIRNLHNYAEKLIVGHQPTNQVIGGVNRLTSRFKYPVTFSSVSAPANVGPWQTWAGSHEYLDDGSRRYIKTSSTFGYLSIPSSQAYGAWYLKIFKNSTAGQAISSFISGVPDELYSGTNQTGYMVYIENVNGTLALFRQNGGGITSLGSAGVGWIPNNEDIEIFIVRKSGNGQFTVWTRESNHPTWTQAIQGTDNTYTTSNFFLNYNAYTSNEFRVYDPVILWPHGAYLEPNDVEFLKD